MCLRFQEALPSKIVFIPWVLYAFPPGQIQKAAQVGFADVGFCDRSWIVPWLFRKTGSNGVLFYISKVVHEVRFIHCAGEVLVLPQMTAVITQAVEVPDRKSVV